MCLLLANTLCDNCYVILFIVVLKMRKITPPIFIMLSMVCFSVNSFSADTSNKYFNTTETYENFFEGYVIVKGKILSSPCRLEKNDYIINTDIIGKWNIQLVGCNLFDEKIGDIKNVDRLKYEIKMIMHDKTELPCDIIQSGFFYVENGVGLIKLNMYTSQVTDKIITKAKSSGYLNLIIFHD